MNFLCWQDGGEQEIKFSSEDMFPLQDGERIFEDKQYVW